MRINVTPRRTIIAASLGLAAGITAGLTTWAIASPSDHQQILTACHTAVADQLKSPSTAKFSQEKVGRRSDQYTIAEGVVDAQNSFGATVRSTYICQTSKTGDHWQVASADVYEH